MPPSQLEKVEPGEFVAVYKAPLEPATDEKAPVFEIHEGVLPESSALNDSEIEVFAFTPLAEEITDDPFAVATVSDVEQDPSGTVCAHLSLVSKASGETANHFMTRNPLLESNSRFGRVFRLLTKDEGVERLIIDPEDTNLSKKELSWLGFTGIEGSGLLQLDLPGEHSHSHAAA